MRDMGTFEEEQLDKLYTAFDKDNDGQVRGAVFPEMWRRRP